MVLRLAVPHFSLSSPFFLHSVLFFLLPTALLQGGKHAREMFYILQTACGQNCSTEGTLSANTFAKIQLSRLPFIFCKFFETIYITSFINACDRMRCDTWMCCISFYDSFYRICVQLLSFYSRIFHSLSQIINSNFSQSSAIHLTVKQNGMPQHMGYKWSHQKFVLNAS